MTAIRTNYMRVHLANQFLESFDEASPNAYYMFLGKVTPWPGEPIADVPFSSYNQDDRIHWNDMLGGESIPVNCVSHVVRRYDWNSGVELFFPGGLLALAFECDQDDAPAQLQR